MTVTQKILADLESWIEKNPLRAFRVEEKLSQSRVALVLGVPQPYVHLMETGVRQPEGAQFDHLASLIGLRTTTLKRRWSEWFGEKPGANDDRKGD